jgi:ABC-2 type transport system permease protein
MSALKAFPALLRVGVSESIAYRADFILWMLTMTLPLVNLALWAAVAADGAVQGYTPARFADYFLTVLLVRHITGNWINWTMGMEIRMGNLSMRLLRPIHPMYGFAAEALSALPLRALFASPILLVILFWVGAESPLYERSWLLILLSFVGAWLLLFAVSVIMGVSAFWIESQQSVFMIWQTFFSVLSGYMVPVELLGGQASWLSTLSNAMPFYYSLGFPVRAVLGQIPTDEIARSLLIQWGYALLFLWLAIVLFRAGVRRFEAFGA